MVTRFSTCHFAEVMQDMYGAVVSPRCSFCGKKCDLVPMPHLLDYDLELTLRRWKDGDCSLDDMFNRVNTELERSWLEAFQAAAEILQGDGDAKYIRKPGVADWEEK